MERSKGSRAVGSRFARATVRTALAMACACVLAIVDARADEAARIDLNTASVAQLTELPGIGPAKAEAIVEYRETAPFKSPDELVQVKGIGAKLFEQLKDKVTVGAAPARAGEAAAQGGTAAGGEAAGGRTAAASGAR